MDSTMHFTFRYSEEDFVRAMRAHFALRLKPKLDIALAVALALLGAYFWQVENSIWFGVVPIVISAIFMLMLVLAFGVLPRQLFRREPKYRDEYDLTFSPDEIHFRTQHINSHLQWSMYSRALIDSHSFILYYGVGSFTVIPKRVFESAEQKAMFEHLIAIKIPKVFRKDI